MENPVQMDDLGIPPILRFLRNPHMGLLQSGLIWYGIIHQPSLTTINHY